MALSTSTTAAQGAQALTTAETAARSYKTTVRSAEVGCLFFISQLSFDVLSMMLSEDGQTDLSELPKTKTIEAHERRKPTALCANVS